MTKAWFNKRIILFVALMVFAGGCSSVNIIRPGEGEVFSTGQVIGFEGEVTRSMQTGGADRSEDLSWESSLDGHIGDGASFSNNALSAGTHNITASWPGYNKSDRVSIQVNP